METVFIVLYYFISIVLKIKTKQKYCSTKQTSIIIGLPYLLYKFK